MISLDLSYANVIAKAEYNGTIITVSICDEDGGALWGHYALREFLDALNITAEDCKKAFEDSEVSDEN